METTMTTAAFEMFRMCFSGEARRISNSYQRNASTGIHDHVNQTVLPMLDLIFDR